MRPGALREGVAEGLKDTLARLKEEGCSVLVVGELPEPVQQLVSQRVLGDQHLDRVRILTLLGPTSDVDGWFPGQISTSSTRTYVIDRQAPDRSGAATSDSGGTFGAPDEDLGFATPGEDGSDVAGAPGCRPALVETVDDDLDPILDEWDVRPARLRLVIAPGNGERPDAETTGAFVESMNAIDGMAYLFLPGTQISELDPDATSRVDAVIEVRTRRPGAPEHRWILPTDHAATEWMPV